MDLSGPDFRLQTLPRLACVMVAKRLHVAIPSVRDSHMGRTLQSEIGLLLTRHPHARLTVDAHPLYSNAVLVRVADRRDDRELCRWDCYMAHDDAGDVFVWEN